MNQWSNQRQLRNEETKKQKKKRDAIKNQYTYRLLGAAGFAS
jgi:hypothetical protein